MSDNTSSRSVLFSGPYTPAYATSGAAGVDLKSTIDVIIPAGQRAIVPTGISLEIPSDTEGQVRSRSGLAASHGVFVLNSPGTIDSDYRGEIKVILMNTSTTEYSVKKGDRIAQLIFSPIFRAVLQPTDQFSETSRGSGGFGSTGVG